MYSEKNVLYLSMLLITTLFACNLPSGTPDETATPDLELTITALAAGGQGNNANTPGSPAVSQETATPEFTAPPGSTSTPSVPQVTVSIDTNCRFGPGVAYSILDALRVGQTAEVVGKNSSVPNYWVIKRINGSGTCWLWGEYATVTGNTSNLPEYPVPATPTPSPTPTFTPTATLAPPAAVNNLVANKVCIPLVLPTYQYTGTINWEDKSNNEYGFNIYLNGALFASIPANSTAYAIPPLPYPLGTPMKLGVEAFNAAGKSGLKDVTIICP